LTRYRQYGEEDMQNNLKCFLSKASGSLAKPPRRKRRKLKTFVLEKVTVHKKKIKRPENSNFLSKEEKCIFKT